MSKASTMWWRTLRQFLDVPLAGEAGSYRIYHTSFADFLTDRARNPTHWADPVLYHDQVANRLLKRFGPVLAKCQVEKPLDRYALRHTAIHLARAASLCRDAGQGEKQHDFTQRLVRLALASGFQDDFEGKLGDLPAIHRIVEEATRRAAEDDDPEGLPLAVETALGLVSFRRRRLTPDKIFTHAAEGDVEGAERKLGLFAAEQDWRQAARLQIAWLAAREAGDTARNLHAQVTASPNPVPPVAILGQRIGAVLAGQGWPKTNLPDVSEEKAQALLARLGSLKSKIGLPDEGAWEAMHMRNRRKTATQHPSVFPMPTASTWWPTRRAIPRRSTTTCATSCGSWPATVMLSTATAFSGLCYTPCYSILTRTGRKTWLPRS